MEQIHIYKLYDKILLSQIDLKKDDYKLKKKLFNLVEEIDPKLISGNPSLAISVEDGYIEYFENENKILWEDYMAEHLDSIYNLILKVSNQCYANVEDY